MEGLPYTVRVWQKKETSCNENLTKHLSVLIK